MQVAKKELTNKLTEKCKKKQIVKKKQTIEGKLAIELS